MTVMQLCYFRSYNTCNFIPSLEILEQKLDDLGHETIYVFPDEARERFWCKDIATRKKVYYLPLENPEGRLRTYVTLRKIFKENNIDIVHSHHNCYDIPVALTAPKNVRIFFHFRTAIDVSALERQTPKVSVTKKLKNALKKPLFKWKLKDVQFISALDYYLKIVTSDKYNFYQKYCDRSEINIIAGGFDATKIPIAENPEKIYDFLTFGHDRFYGKGGDVIIKACERLEKEGYKFNILFCGHWAMETWNEFNSFMQDRSSSYDWLEKCEVTENVVDLYNKSSVFISASRGETFSFGVCEAVYAGLHVISSDIPGLQWAKEIPSVTFFRDGDSDDLYRCMKDYLDSKVVIDSKMIEAGRNIIDKKYSADVWAEKLIQLYAQ